MTAMRHYGRANEFQSGARGRRDRSNRATLSLNPVETLVDAFRFRENFGHSRRGNDRPYTAGQSNP